MSNLKLVNLLSEIQVMGFKPLIAKPTYADDGRLYTIYDDNDKKVFKITKWTKYSQTGLFTNPDSLNLQKIKDFLKSRGIKFELIKGKGIKTYINIPNKYIKF